MTRQIFVRTLAALVLIGAGGAVPVHAQDRPMRPAPETSQVIVRPVDLQLESWGRYRRSGHPAVRVWQDYLLKRGDTVRDVLVVSGAATIEGVVDGDVVVVFGSARVTTTAVIHGSLVVVAGGVTVEDGAAIDRDLVVVGGSLDTPPGFTPGGEHVVVGTGQLGDRIKAVVPWVTYGLLWGRPIVPSLAWVWGIVTIFLILSLTINLVMHEPVGACADVLVAKPFSTFLAGLLVLLLVGPVSVLLAATLVGLAVVPFLWCALIAAWIVGKVGVLRWIGRSLMSQGAEESRNGAMGAVLIGFAVICVLYAVPVLGFIAWATVGVFGLGAASMACLAALRAERPAPPPVVLPPPMPTPPAPPPPPVRPLEPGLSGGPVSFATAAPAHAPIGDSTVFAPAVALAADLTAMPRATFLDRTAAFALDLLLVLLIDGVLDLPLRVGVRWMMALFYFAGFWTWKGTTVGGIICNLRVIRTDGAPLRFADAIVRALSSLFSFAALGLGCLWILRDPERQAWHDRIAGTYVVRVPRNWPLP